MKKIVGASSIQFRTFTELKDHIGSETSEGRKPLIAIELPDGNKFIAFHIRELRQNSDRTYGPVSEGYIYDCSLPDGFNSPNGESSYRLDNYPVNISYRDFRRYGVYIIKSGTDLAKYIEISIASGRTEAHKFWSQLQEASSPTPAP